MTGKGLGMASFSDLYTLYYKRSFLFAKSYVRDDMVAEDLASEAIIQLWETTKKEPVEHPVALLAVILKHKALNYLSREQVKLESMEAISSKSVRDMDYRISSLKAFDPEEVFSSEITEIVRKALESLPEQTRRVFEMSRYEQMSVKEIAERTSLSAKSVEYHITRSLKVLRVALKDYLPIFYLLFFLDYV